MVQWIVIGWMMSPSPSQPLRPSIACFCTMSPQWEGEITALQTCLLQDTTLLWHEFWLQLVTLRLTNCYTAWVGIYGRGVELRHCGRHQIAHKANFLHNVALMCRYVVCIRPVVKYGKQTDQNLHSALAAFTGVKVLWVEFAASVEVFIYYSYKWAQKHISLRSLRQPHHHL